MPNYDGPRTPKQERANARNWLNRMARGAAEQLRATHYNANKADLTEDLEARRKKLHEDLLAFSHDIGELSRSGCDGACGCCKDK